MTKHTKNEIISTLLISLITLAIAFFLVLLVKANPLTALEGFIKGIFSSPYNFSEVLAKMCPLLLCAIGISVAFQTNFINIGAEGQLYIGAIVATVVGLYFKLPPFLLITVSFLFSFIAGGIYSMIPGLLKAKFNLSEVINTIMLNYIAIGLTSILVQTVLRDPNGYFPMTAELNTTLPILIKRTRFHLGIIVAIIAVIAIQLWLTKTRTGFSIRATGQNARASLCSGISVNKSLIISSLVSGGFAGLAGAIEILGLQHKLLVGISSGYGYTAIIVALLADNKPKRCFLSALMIAALQVGSLSMQRYAKVPSSIASLLMGVIVLLHLGKKTIFAPLFEEKN